MTIAKFTPTKSPHKPKQLALLGARIRVLRKSKGITQGTLAKLMDSATPVISNLERGNTNPTIMTFLRLCYALDVEPNSVLDYMRKDEDCVLRST
jgi:transcriptional regulator with XRE-family HTH domain